MLLLFQNIVDGVASIWHAPCKLMKKVNSIECLNCQSFYNFSISGLSLLKKISPKIPLTKNPSIYNIVCWADGTNDSSTKRLVFQVLFVYKITKMKIESFESPNSIRNYKIFGWSVAWSTSRLSHLPSKPAYYIVDCRTLKEYYGVCAK